MNSRKIIKGALVGCDRQEVAAAMNITLGSLNNQIAGEKPYYPKGITLNFVDRVLNFIDSTYETTGRMDLLEAIAEEFGFLLIKNPAIHAADSPAVSKISEILRDFGVMLEEIGKANADQIIEKYEAEKIRAKWEVMKRMTEEFVLACETGCYAGKNKCCP